MVDLIARSYARILPLHARGKLLDLGCGKAPLYGSYKELVSSCVCVDWANTAHKNEHLDLECDLTQPLPFADGEFDTIILSDVLEHIPTPEALCHEMARSLALQGKLILNVPFFYGLHEEPHDFYRYTLHGIRHLLEKSGFMQLDIRPVGGYFRLLARRLLNGLQFFPGIWFVPAALLLGPPALVLPLLDGLDRERNFTLGYICTAKRR